MNKFFSNVKVDMNNDRSMFEYIKGHFTYYTMNSWNGLSSIANNVKVYKMELSGNPWRALNCLERDEYFIVNEMISDWESEHKEYEVGFNGRSSGYLVLYSRNTNASAMPDFINDNENYDEYKAYCKAYYGGVKYNHSTLRIIAQDVLDFDILCDRIRDYVNDLSNSNYVEDTANLITDMFNDSNYAELNGLTISGAVHKGNGRINITSFVGYSALVKAFFDLVRQYDTAQSYTSENGIVQIHE